MTASRSNGKPSTRAPSHAATELFIALGAVVKRLRRHPLPDTSDEASALARANLAPRHVAALLHIAADGPIGITELAERLHVSLATMSQLVTELGEWRLVERSHDEADRRRTLVTISPEHRPLIRGILEQRLRPLQRTLDRLEPAEREVLVRGLLVLAEELDRLKGKQS